MDKKVKRNYVYNLIYQIFLIIIPILTTPYVSRVLFSDGVGKYSFSYSIVSYFVLFASFGFGYYAQREIAKFNGNIEEQSKIFWEIFILKIITSLVSLIVYFILIFSGILQNYNKILIILSILIISVALDPSYLLQGNEEFKKIVPANLVVRILGIISIFIFVKTSEHVWIYALIIALSGILTNLFIWFYSIKYLTKVSIKELRIKKHFVPALKLFLPTIAISIYTTLDKTLIGAITGSDAENGYYEQAEKIVKMAMTLITCLGTVMIPRNTSEISKGNHEKVKDNIYVCFNFIWLLGVPLTLGIILISSNFIPWFLGEDFFYCSLLMKVLSFLVLIIGCSNILGLQYMIPYGKEKHFTISLITGSFVNLIFNIFLIKMLGSLGAAISTIIAESVVSIIMFLLLSKNLSFTRIFKSLIKPLIAGIIMFLCVYPITLVLSSNIINTLIIVILGVLVYGISIILLREKLFISFLKKIKRD